ncbi:MAG: PSD1 and planctomycete cytochrome C domain-containing protein, partial [Verrucomicrobiota bacterium]|nr:PSD1 and planctomycete cytochrome C domain-containing protein [Verrucomicrobiota bacterium]
GKGDSDVPILVPGKPEASLLWHRVQTEDVSQRMPPEDQPPLTTEEVHLMERWIQEGAHWPLHWAFEPPKPGSQRSSQLHPVDARILEVLNQKGMEPCEPAAPTILLRRLYLDLTGLLPSPDQWSRHLDMLSRGAFHSVVHQILASPHFGERWARHWLDQARYADSLGYEKDSVKKDAWQYRDWVVQAFNADMPFDRFSALQLAGDLIDPGNPQALLATKIHLQTQFNLEGGIDAEEDRVKRVIDRVNMVGATWLGITVGCAQCHDHPYDPFSQSDYYHLMAFFNNVDEEASFLHRVPDEAQLESVLMERRRLQDQLETMLQRQLTDKSLNNQVVGQLVKLFQYDQNKGLTRHMRERSQQRRATHVLIRGDFRRPNLALGNMEPAVPAIGKFLPSPPNHVDRRFLAEWLFAENHPLTARVFINKVWGHLLGQPLVETPQDFGSRAPEPVHRELLDWMSSWWMDQGRWSLKELIRMIVTSKTYQQSSTHRPHLSQVDPQNRFFARQNRFRVEAEVLRDIALQMCGLLDLRIGGPAVFPPMPEVVIQQSYSRYHHPSQGGDRYRRGLYTFFRRTAPDPNLMVFDCPDASASQALRGSSNNPLQALAILNNEVFHEAAQSLAQRLWNDSDLKTDQQRLTRLFEWGFGRAPSEKEADMILPLLAVTRAHTGEHPDQLSALQASDLSEMDQASERAAWVAVARLILNLDAFITRE